VIKKEHEQYYYNGKKYVDGIEMKCIYI